MVLRLLVQRPNTVLLVSRMLHGEWRRRNHSKAVRFQLIQHLVNGLVYSQASGRKNAGCLLRSDIVDNVGVVIDEICVTSAQFLKGAIKYNVGHYWLKLVFSLSGCSIDQEKLRKCRFLVTKNNHVLCCWVMFSCLCDCVFTVLVNILYDNKTPFDRKHVWNLCYFCTPVS